MMVADLRLTGEAARARLVPPMTTVMGLVAHVTFVEQLWFHSRVAGVDRDDLGLAAGARSGDTAEEGRSGT
jgi:hypothetical protein